ncbi:MAG: hypothetical protein ACREDA_02715, partial [Methylocella sp.]
MNNVATAKMISRLTNGEIFRKVTTCSSQEAVFSLRLVDGKAQELGTAAPKSRQDVGIAREWPGSSGSVSEG